jgi:hypothetical protein
VQNTFDPTSRECPPSSETDQGALRIQSFALAPMAALHASQTRLLEALASGRRDFVDLHKLPQPLSPATIVLGTRDGKQFAVDASGPKPILRPLASTSPAAAASRRTEPRPDAMAAASEKGAPQAAQPKPKEPGFGEKLLAESGQALAQQFMSALGGGRPIGAAIQETFGPGGLLNAMGSKSISGLGDMLMGSMMGQLFGGIDDSSSAGAQIAARFGPALAPQAAAGLGMIATPEGFAALKAKISGAKSTASIPLGMGPGGGARVSVNGQAALVEGDLAVHGTIDDSAPFGPGNPKVLINGKPAIGKKHFAICPKHGAQINPVECSANVFIGEDPAPPVAKNEAGKQIGDRVDASKMTKDELDTLQEQLSESEEGGIGRPLELRDGEVQRAKPWDPSDLARDLFGIENIATSAEKGLGIDKWSILWGAIELGSPQEPGAGTRGKWVVPDKIFGYDMSPYYLLHDRIFNDDRTVADIQRVLGVEASAFGAGIAGHGGSGLMMLQTIYSGVTTAVAVGSAVGNSLGSTEKTPAREGTGGAP